MKNKQAMIEMEKQFKAWELEQYELGMETMLGNSFYNAITIEIINSIIHSLDNNYLNDKFYDLIINKELTLKMINDEATNTDDLDISEGGAVDRMIENTMKRLNIEY